MEFYEKCFVLGIFLQDSWNWIKKVELVQGGYTYKYSSKSKNDCIINIYEYIIQNRENT